MKADLSDNYKEIKNFVIEQELNLEDNSPLCKAISNNFEILKFIDHWLGKYKRIKGGDKLTEKLRLVGLRNSDKSVADDYQKWYQLLSELETFYFLSNNLGLNVTGYEQAPAGINKPPDFEIKHSDENVYFEVKFKASEVTQKIPQELNKLLDQIEEKYGNEYRITIMETQNSENSERCPNYLKLFSKYLLLPENVNAIEKKLQEHLNVLKRHKILEREDRRSSFCEISIRSGAETVAIHFSVSLKWANSERRLFGFRPDEIGDIRSWLLSDQGGKTPMVREAERKGADYLVCFVPFRANLNETFYDYVTPLFSDIQILKSNIAISRDANLRQLSGVIILSQKGSLTNNYVIVSNANVTPKIEYWIGNVSCY